MCAEYEIRKSQKQIEAAIGAPSTGDENVYVPRVRLFGAAPIVTGRNGTMRVERARFSLKPPFVKYATFNARLFDFDERKNQITSIYQKPTWKIPFAERRCLVPITGFVEPVYVGENAGHMIEFTDNENETLFAAALYEETIISQTGEIYAGFALVMDAASEFVKGAGHHREPVFLGTSGFEEWLYEDMPAEDRVRFLTRKKRRDLKLSTRVDRPMARGWQKRIASFLAKSEREARFERMIADNSCIAE